MAEVTEDQRTEPSLGPGDACESSRTGRPTLTMLMSDIGEATTAGYCDPAYAQSLAEFGTPVKLPCSGGWLLERGIPNSSLKDAMNCYPLFCCPNWPGLKQDIRELSEQLVSVALVTDPFASISLRELAETFDTVEPFKDHFVVDATRSNAEHVSSHHRYYSEKALKTIQVELVDAPSAWLDRWCELYGGLVRRHELRGIKAFSRSAFERQLRMPSLIMFRAFRGKDTLGAHLWILQSGVAYSHLAAYSSEGYVAGASYALYWCGLQRLKEQFSGKLKWIDVGGGAGVRNDTSGGLTKFKRDWANEKRTVYFCGRILERASYTCLTAQAKGTAYFPAYRSGEMA